MKPGGERKPALETEVRFHGVPSGTPGAGEVVARAGPDPSRRPRFRREPTVSEGASPSSEAPDRRRVARATEGDLPRLRRHRASGVDRPPRWFPSGHGAMPVRPGGFQGASPGIPAFVPRSRGATAPERVAVSRRDRGGARAPARPGGQPPEPGRARGRGPSRVATGHAERELRTSKKPVCGPDQPRTDLDDGTAAPPPGAAQRPRHERPPPTIGQPIGGGSTLTTPPAEVRADRAR